MIGSLKKWFLSKCSEYRELQIQIQDLNIQCSNLQQNNFALTRQLEERDRVLSMQAPESEMEQINIALQQQIQDLNSQISYLQQQNASVASTVLPETNSELTDRLKQAESTANQLTSKCDALKREIEESKQALENSNSRLVQAEVENENLQKEIAPLRQENENLQNEIAPLRQENEKQQSEIAEQRQTITNLQSENTGLRQNITNLQNTNGTLQEKIGVLQQTITNLQSKNTELRQTITNLQNENTGLRQEIDNLQNENAELEKTCLEWKDYCDKLAQQHEAEKEEIQTEWQAVVNDQVQKHSAELQAEKAEHAKDIDAKNTEIKNLHADYCQKLREENEKSEQVKAQCKKTIETTETQCKNAIANAQNACNNEIAKLKSEHQKNMDLKETQIKNMVAQCAEDLKQAEIKHQNSINSLIARENQLLGAGIADFFRSQSIENQENRKYHLFLSLICACDQENNFAGVQNAYLLLDDLLKARYRQEPEVLNEKRQLIRKLFNENVRTIEIEELPEIGKHKLDYNQSHYTVRGSGNIITSVESPCLIYKNNNNVRPGLIYCV